MESELKKDIDNYVFDITKTEVYTKEKIIRDLKRAEYMREYRKMKEKKVNDYISNNADNSFNFDLHINV